MPDPRRITSPWLRRCVGLLNLVAGLCLAVPTSAAEATYLDPAQAFRASANVDSEGSLAIEFVIAEGYHLYRDRFSIRAVAPLELVPPSLPEGIRKFDAALGETMTQWQGTVRVHQALPKAAQTGSLEVTYQGCADRGLCYPPQRGTVTLIAGGDGALVASWQSSPDMFAAPAQSAALSHIASAPVIGEGAPAPAPASAGDANAQALASGSLLKVLPLFLLGGLLLSFTPCVLPMLPILSSIIVGQGAPVSRRRGFTLSLAYSLGMALVYTFAGIAAGLLGAGFAVALQNPWVLGTFALLLSGFALSMFGIWDFQMPQVVQQHINNASNRFGSGRYLAVFATGGLSALLVGPCVAAPLAGVLVYISRTGDVVLGGAALFALAFGMSVPLLLLGLSAGGLLPRAGRWMEHVKTLFGVVLLATALWLVSPVLPMGVVMFILGGGTLVILMALQAFNESRAALLRGVAVVLGLWSVALVAGALSGGDSVIQPLRHLTTGSGAQGDVQRTPADANAFRRITHVDELEDALRLSQGPVVVDFYADWCVSCKEMEHGTLQEPAIRSRLSHAQLLRVDVTEDTADARALMKRFQLFGPPAMLFFDAHGVEVSGARSIGYEEASIFARHLDAAQL